MVTGKAKLSDRQCDRDNDREATIPAQVTMTVTLSVANNNDSDTDSKSVSDNDSEATIPVTVTVTGIDSSPLSIRLPQGAHVGPRAPLAAVNLCCAVTGRENPSAHHHRTRHHGKCSTFTLIAKSSQLNVLCPD